MADIASLSLEVKTDSLKQATAALRDLPVAASAAERAAQKWGTTMDANARSADDFSKRVQRTISDLQFQQQQLTRTSAEQERFTALRRAGVSASSAEGQAITASVMALQAQKAALGQTSAAAKVFGDAWSHVKALATVAFLVELTRRLLEFAKQSIEAVGGLDEMAEQAGLTTRAFQALQFSSVQNGVALEQMQTGIAKFSQKIGEAATGSKPMLDSLDALGVKILDAQGKLRPTEDLLQDVAQAILKIEDPAKRAAASVDFFGKAGTKFMPVLAEIAKGTEFMARSAEAAGVMVGDVLVKRLDAFSDAAERGALRTRNWAASFAGLVLLGVDTFTASLTNGAEAFDKWLSSMLGVSSITDAFKAVGVAITKVVDDSQVEAARWGTMFVDAFKEMPAQLGALFADAWQAAFDKTVGGLAAITGWLNAHAPAWMGFGTGPGSGIAGGLAGGAGLSGLAGDGTTPSGFDPAGMAARALAAGQAAADQARQAQAQGRLASQFAAQAGMQGRGAAAGTFGLPKSGGASNPPATGSGKEAENQEKAYQKLAAQLEATATAQDLMTAASAKGDQQFEAVKIHLDAQQKALEIYGKALDDNDPKLTRLEALLTRISQGKAAEAFNVATTELQKQNVILQAQIDLMGQAPDIQAREIALIKSKQEAEKAGTAVTQEMIDARKVAIEQNETLKTQQEDLKKAQDLWTEPLKRALSDIQSTAADAFETMLSTGNFTFQSLADSFKKVITRMIAEFLALATVRPVMSVLVNAVSPGLAQQFGLGSGNTAGGVGGGGLGGLFGGGTGGGLGDFFGQTLFGGSENFGPLQPGAASLGTSGGVTVGGALGGLAGIGMGAFSILSGKGSTGSLLGGGASILGGGLSLLGPMLGLGAAAGPIGIGLGLLGSILPSLLGGGSKPAPPINQTNAQLSFGSGGAFTTGSAFGPDANSTAAQSALSDLGKSMQSVFDLFGGLKDPSKAWGVSTETTTQKSGDGTQEGWDFSSTSNFLTGPGGQKELFRMNETGMDDKAAAYALYKSIEEGAVGAISDNMKQAFNTAGATQSLSSVQAISDTVQQIQAFDEAVAKFGKDVAPGEDAINQVDASFQSLYDTVKQYNLAASETAKIDAEKLRQEQKVTGDFTYSISQALLGFTDPTAAAINDLGKQRADQYAQNAAFLKLVTGYQDQSLNIEELYRQQVNKIIADGNAQALAEQQAAAAAQKQVAIDLANSIGQSVARVQDLIDQLSPGGALGNVDPATQLAALKASYSASLAQALSDPTNDTLIQKAVADAQAFTETSLKYNAGDATYESDRQNALAQLQALQQATTGAGLAQSTDPDVKNLLQKIAAAVSEPTNDNAQRDADMATVLALLARFLANGKTAA